MKRRVFIKGMFLSLFPSLKKPEGKAIYHVKNNGCKKIAFYYSGKFEKGFELKAKHFTLPDGSKPKDGKAMVCGSCGDYIYPPLVFEWGA